MPSRSHARSVSPSARKPAARSHKAPVRGRAVSRALRSPLISRPVFGLLPSTRELFARSRRLVTQGSQPYALVVFSPGVLEVRRDFGPVAESFVLSHSREALARFAQSHNGFAARVGDAQFALVLPRSASAVEGLLEEFQSYFRQHVGARPSGVLKLRSGASLENWKPPSVRWGVAEGRHDRTQLPENVLRAMQKEAVKKMALHSHGPHLNSVVRTAFDLGAYFGRSVHSESTTRPRKKAA